MQRTWVRSLVQEDPTWNGVSKPMWHNYWGHILKPKSLNYRACMSQLLKPVSLELKSCNKGSHDSEKAMHCNKEIVRLLQLEKVWEKAMAPHSSTVAWKIPWMEEPGRLQSTGLLRVRHDWMTSLPLSTFMHWRRKWQPTPVFLPGESHGRRSLVGCSPWGCTEFDTTEST